MRLELWNERPPTGVQGWQSVGESTFTVEGRRLRLWSVTAAQADEDLELPRAGGYAAHVYLQGREAAERLEEATFEHGVERWVIRIWPTHA